MCEIVEELKNENKSMNSDGTRFYFLDLSTSYCSSGSCPLLDQESISKLLRSGFPTEKRRPKFISRAANNTLQALANSDKF